MTKTLNLETASLAVLVDHYNTLTGQEIKKFSDRKSAIARIMKATEAKKAAHVAASKAARTPKVADAAAAAKKQAAADKKATITAARQAGLAMQITLLAPANPKRVGTLAHGRFELYRSGMTVEQYLEAAKRHAQVLRSEAHGMKEQVHGARGPAWSRAVAKRDLKFDRARGYIAFDGSLEEEGDED